MVPSNRILFISYDKVIKINVSSKLDADVKIYISEAMIFVI